MEFVIERLTGQPTLVLLGGSAVLAAGLSILLGVALHVLRVRRLQAESRRRAVAAAAEAAAHRVDLVDCVPSRTSAPSVDLAAIDARLEDVEMQLERLHARIDAVVRQRESHVRRRPATPASAQSTGGSEEEKILREMVARVRS